MPTALGAALHSQQNGHLAFGTSASLSRLLLASNVGVVQLHNPPEAIAGFPIFHGLSDLVTPAPGSWITQTQIHLYLTSGGPSSAGCHKEYGPKPIPQRLPGLVKDGVGSNRSLMPTLFTLV